MLAWVVLKRHAQWTMRSGVHGSRAVIAAPSRRDPAFP
jgi:hypothetical protein